MSRAVIHKTKFSVGLRQIKDIYFSTLFCILTGDLIAFISEISKRAEKNSKPQVSKFYLPALRD
jgi:hypothetical protein